MNINLYLHRETRNIKKPIEFLKKLTENSFEQWLKR